MVVSESPVGIAGTLDRYDALVEIRERDPENDGEGVTVIIESPVRALFSAQQDKAVESILQALSITTASVRVKDNHALDFVLRARTAAAAQRLRAKGERI